MTIDKSLSNATIGMRCTYTFTVKIETTQNQNHNIEKVIERIMSECFKICSIDGVNPEVVAKLNSISYSDE